MIRLKVLTWNPSHFFINTKAAVKLNRVKISIWILQGTLDQIRMLNLAHSQNRQKKIENTHDRKFKVNITLMLNSPWEPLFLETTKIRKRWCLLSLNRFCHLALQSYLDLRIYIICEYQCQVCNSKYYTARKATEISPVFMVLKHARVFLRCQKRLK